MGQSSAEIQLNRRRYVSKLSDQRAQRNVVCRMQRSGDVHASQRRYRVDCVVVQHAGVRSIEDVQMLTDRRTHLRALRVPVQNENLAAAQLALTMERGGPGGDARSRRQAPLPIKANHSFRLIQRQSAQEWFSPA